jgi:AraC-like DNA-binding protein
MRKPSPDREFVSSLVPRFASYAANRGIVVGPVLRQFGFPEDAENLSELRGSLQAFRELSNELAHLSGDLLFGANVAMRARRGAFGLVEFLTRSAGTLRDALDPVVRYCRLINDALTFSLEPRGKDLALTFGVNGQTDHLGRHGNEHVLGATLHLGRQLVGMDWPSPSAWLSHSGHGEAHRLRTTLGAAAIQFRAPSNGMVIPAEVLSLPVVTADPELFSVLDAQAKKVLPAAVEEDDFARRVAEKIERGLSSGLFNVDPISDSLKMSPRTLQRRLAEAGTSFVQLLDKVRYATALKLLEDPKRPLGEVAFIVGYSELRAFNRAFRRWAGTTPGELRRSSRGVTERRGRNAQTM